MTLKSSIEWCHATWNPFHGCRKVSPGCKFCYMYRDKERYGKDPREVLKSKTTFNDPLKWQRDLGVHEFERARDPSSQYAAPPVGIFPGMRIFTCSWSDFFIEEADDDFFDDGLHYTGWRTDAWDIIRQTPEFEYLILTKRPERIAQCLPADWGDGYPNVWLGVSVESQAQMHRINTLSESPAAIRWVSFEPLIGKIDIRDSTPCGILCAPGIDKMDWAVIGGESGNEPPSKYRYRPCFQHWIRNLIVDCEYVGINVFVKQLGTHLAKRLKLKDRHGREMKEWNETLRVREFPEKQLHNV